jgi:hypothetical protein
MSHKNFYQMHIEKACGSAQAGCSQLRGICWAGEVFSVIREMWTAGFLRY